MTSVSWLPVSGPDLALFLMFAKAVSSFVDSGAISEVNGGAELSLLPVLHCEAAGNSIKRIDYVHHGGQTINVARLTQ